MNITGKPKTRIVIATIPERIQMPVVLKTIVPIIIETISKTGIQLHSYCFPGKPKPIETA
jgi:hypothetical protein